MPDLPILLVLLLLIAVLLRLDFAYYLLYLGLGAFFFARWWTNRGMQGLRITRRFDDHAFLGQVVPVEVTVENATWGPLPWLRLDETLPTNLTAGRPLRQVMSLRPRERQVISYTVTSWQRGYYEIGPALLNTGDLFGFAEARARTTAADHLTVYPRVIPLAELELNCRSPYGTIKSQQRIFSDPARSAGKRDYHPGDPLRQIDWKSSAHAASLQVKKYDPSVSLHSVIFLNLNVAEYGHLSGYQSAEWGIVVAASLGNYLSVQRQSVGLGSNGVDSLSGRRDWTIPPGPGRAHLMKLLEWLARVQLVETTPFADWLPRASMGLAWGTTVIVIDPAGDEKLCSVLHGLVRRGLNPVLVVIEPQYRFGTVRERARRLGFAAHLVTNEHDLERWGQAARPTARASK